MRGLATLLLIGLMAATPERAGAAPIIDGPTVLQRSPAAIQATLGQPVRVKGVPSGDVHLPDGGTSRVYDGRGTRIDIDFEEERSTTVVIAFPDVTVAPRRMKPPSKRSISGPGHGQI